MLGHGVGDEALREVAVVLMSSCRSTDIIGRIGGDEFCTAVGGACMEDARSAVEAAQLRLEAKNRDEGRPYDLKCSVGLTEYDPGRHHSLAELLEESDARMYQAKRGRSVKAGWASAAASVREHRQTTAVA